MAIQSIVVEEKPNFNFANELKRCDWGSRQHWLEICCLKLQTMQSNVKIHPLEWIYRSVALLLIYRIAFVASSFSNFCLEPKMVFRLYMSTTANDGRTFKMMRRAKFISIKLAWFVPFSHWIIYFVNWVEIAHWNSFRSGNHFNIIRQVFFSLRFVHSTLEALIMFLNWRLSIKPYSIHIFLFLLK